MKEHRLAPNKGIADSLARGKPTSKSQRLLALLRETLVVQPPLPFFVTQTSLWDPRLSGNSIPPYSALINSSLCTCHIVLQLAATLLYARNWHVQTAALLLLLNYISHHFQIVRGFSVKIH
ncbi:hypothetical protein XELAEV_18023063mg [Xenopus laevis]|uniref:Uncharacterized protein n=1 Tax=Xenopus laevis TaxID=8355 RepID=A0A974HP91_XENLA|nr:hypothetical protein XELAEV_18023063mg [Xenopus laevis]